MSIKLFQLDRVWNEIGQEVLDFIHSAHSKGQAQNGDLTKALETELQNRFNKRHCITVASCTDALDISLQALKLPSRSQVAVSNYTFTASAHAIARAGYNVTPIDVTDTYCIDPDQITNVKAVVAVDLFGNMTDYKKLFAKNIPVIVDAAQSLESMDQFGKWSAQYGLASCVSFSPSKTISSWGSGGAILTDDDDFADRCKKLRLHGKLSNNDLAIAPGLNSMMSSAECAAVLVGFKHSDKWYKRRSEISNYLIQNSSYKSGMDISICNAFSKLVFQSTKRDNILKKFKADNIDAVVHYNNLISNESLYNANICSQSEQLKHISFTVPNQHTLTDLEVESIEKILR